MTLDLKAEHDALRVALRSFEDIARSGSPADISALVRERTKFSKLFRQHLKHEGSRTETLRTGREDCLREQAQREYGSRLRVLLLDYSAHIKAWTPARIDAQWARYRSDVLALQKGLYALMAWEENILHPLLDAA